MTALARLLDRAEANGVHRSEHFVFPACENERLDPTRPQKTWRTAWRKLVREAARTAGRNTAKLAIERGSGIIVALREWRSAAAPFLGFRFHDLRHQAITELAEAGPADATLMAVAGHIDREMMEHYSHVRMAAKREVLSKLESGLMAQPSSAPPSEANPIN
jgi:integrase